MCFVSDRFSNHVKFFADAKDPWNLPFRVLVSEFVHDILGELTE